MADHDIRLPAEPPYVAVIFRSLRNDNDEGYAETGVRMEALVAEQPGYLGHWSARDADGRGVTISYWVDEPSATAWRDVAEHLAAQQHGAKEWYAAYATEVCVVTRAYAKEQR
jgi:heme-degrading monooxygenase HmoA